MHQHYDDIRSQIASDPLWFDECAVPRYCAFAPDKTANIYADECALLLIGCQGCGRAFRVALSESLSSRALRAVRTRRKIDDLGSLAQAVRAREVHYGDPPNVGCCPAGPTMNSEPRRVLEFWARSATTGGWQRVRELELDIEPDWVPRRASYDNGAI